tara:strand:- start:32938 stop:34305 length:1368 start_codon:yes stop_codon:yes gene_type:complete
MARPKRRNETNANRSHGRKIPPSETGLESAGAPIKPTRSAARKVVPIILLLLAVSGLAWILRGIPQQCIRRAEHAMLAMRFDEAEQYLSEYPSWGTDPGKVAFLQARVARSQEGYVRSLAYLNDAESIGFDPNATARERTLLAASSSLPNPQLLARLTNMADQAESDRPAVYEALANGTFQVGAVDEALDVLDRWSEEFPNDGRPFYWKGWMHQLLGDRKTALAMFIESTNRNPDMVDAYLAQATGWSALLRHDRALQAYRMALDAEPDRIDTRVAMGKLLWKLDQRNEAAELLKPIARSSPNIYPAGELVAQYHLMRNEPQQAISILQSMTQHFPDDASLNYMLASAHDQIDNIDESTAAMNQFFIANKELDQLRADRFDVPLEQQYAEVIRRASQYRRFDWVQSLKWLDLATQSQPDNPEPHILLARHHTESGSNSQAKRHQNIAEFLAQKPR